MLRLATALLFALALVPLVVAQADTPRSTAKGPSASGNDEQIYFQFTHKYGRPQRYTITLHRDGRATYESVDVIGKDLNEREGHSGSSGKFEDPAAEVASEPTSEPYKVEFTASEDFRREIFDLVKAANDLEGDFDSKKKNLADLGHKTAIYTNGSTRNRTEWMWSENKTIDDLADDFQRLSNTLEAGQRLAFERRFDKLALANHLKELDDLADRDGLREIQAISPVLHEIMNDPGVMNIARDRAAKLLKPKPKKDDEAK